MSIEFWLPNPEIESTELEMDDLDEFLAELESSAVISPTLSTNPSHSNSASIEKELYDIFGDITLDTVTVNENSANISVEKNEFQSVVSSSLPSNNNPPKPDDFDVLTWLESPSKNIVTKDISPNSSGKSKSSPLLTSKQIAKLDLKTSSIDSFFDDVFGIDTTKKTTSSPRTPRCSTIDFDKAIKTITNSTFPDISKLKSIIIDAGYIPHSLRGAVWSLLLTGSITEDEEIKTYRPSEFALNNQHKILSDCEAIVTRYNSKSGSNSVVTDMYDVLILFCLRKEIEYMPLYCDLLVPFFLGNEGNSLLLSRPLASTCFYSFVNKCVPFINLSIDAMELSITKIHFWLRLLLIYHNPVIAQHLDRVVPGWEQPSRGFSASEASSKVNQVMISDGLDELEKELGLGFNTGSADSGHVQSARPSAANNACIPIHWICGFFCSSLPPEQASYLIDWILLVQDRYAGVYLTIALFEIFASQLVCMNNSKIKEWFDKIASNQVNWFHTCELTGSSDVTFTDFTRGWIYAATRVMRTTPISFRTALEKTEEWAATTAANNNIPAEFVDSNIPMLNDDQFNEQHVNDFDIDDILPTTTTSKNSSNMSTAASGQSLIEGIKRLSMTFPSSAVNAPSESNATQAVHTHYPHDMKTESNTMVLWTEVGEVIPCICTNKLRPYIQGDILTNFQQGLSILKTNGSNSGAVRGDDAMCFPSPQEPNEKPFYFGIDCRSDAERMLGLFPKAFTVDPATITDTEAVSHLLLTLEPLVNSVHLCVIGAGEEYIRYIYRNQTQDTLTRALSDHSAKLNAVAMFFLKKGFKYVSILDGGFYSACQYLRRPDIELTVTTALIDPDIASLDLLFADNTAIVSTSSSNNTLNTIVSNISTATSAITSNVTEAVGSLLLKLSEPTTPPRSAAVTASNTSDSNDNTGTTSKLFSDFGRRVSLLGTNSFESFKKTITNVNITASSTAAPSAANNKPNPLAASVSAKKDYSNAFVIDDEEDEEDEGRDDNKITISKTEQEKQRALAIHKVAGLRRCDQIVIARESLPGALLYPATKYIADAVTGVSTEGEMQDEKKEELSSDNGSKKPLHRYLVVTRERFLILDSGGKGVGTTATVKANHHLTELLKMTFRKKDPELITLFFLNDQGPDQDPVTKMFRVSKRKEFVETLQRNMQYFK